MSMKSKHGREKSKSCLPDDETPELTDGELEEASGGDRPLPYDPINTFCFSVEIDGMTQDAIQPTDDPAFKVRKPD